MSSELFTTILEEVVNQNNTNSPLVLPPDKEHRIARQLAFFVTQAIEKYINGQKEHGGDLRDRDLPLELHKEILDLFWYNSEQLEKRHDKV